ncbi:hypothetical protein AJ79_07829 [Helicocarpus griseus UAMH5409]|uniref:Uncharacterized protein n=1 Tax=Helicocarpus griseus UAMH5409 TaxID=1447875 RepID=A0A2B7WZ21_9EURO|nr:hypothetical protein AJ79_07829 [Helicocarpus griseus UAMH5409]
MSSTVTQGRQWPPSPSVEDECQSLSRELLDPSELNMILSDDAVMSKGTVDQIPVILPSNLPTPCSTPTDACGSPFGSSQVSDGNTGLTIPSSVDNNGVCAPAFSEQGQSKNNNAPSEFVPQPCEHSPNRAENSLQQKPGLSRHFSEGDELLGPHEPAGKQPEWHSDDEACPSYCGANSSELPSNGSQPKTKKKVVFQLPDDHPNERLACQEAESAPADYFDCCPRLSEEAHSSRRSSKYYQDERAMDSYDPTFVTYRQDYTHLAHPQPLKLNCNYAGPRSRTSDSGSPVASPLKLTSRSPAQSPQRHTPSPSSYRLSPIARTALDITKAVMLPTPNKESRSSRNSSPVRRRGPFLSPQLLPAGYEVIVRRGSDKTDKQSRRNSSPPISSSTHLLSRSRSSTVPSQVVVRRHQSVSAPPPTIALAPCPRFTAMAGHQDWYTIKGFKHIDICPSCMNQIGNSRFRDLFIPGLPKPRDQVVRCSLSQPWARLAWVQTMKLKLNHLDLLYHITHPQPGSRPCTGRNPSVQAWYRLSDPETGRTVSDFNACSSCFRNLQILMPSLRDAFRSGPLVQERVCDLRVDSPRFVRYLDLLDEAATRSSYTRSRLDMRDFIRYARRKSNIRNCTRDHPASGPWHFIPDLPEFTICEDCYDDVVYDLKDTGIGRMVTRTPRDVPGQHRDQLLTCQLYSPRMRTVFRDAVHHGDYKYLAAAAIRRHEAEKLFRQRKRRLFDDVTLGYDRDMELRLNADDWRRCE